MEDVPGDDFITTLTVAEFLADRLRQPLVSARSRIAVPRTGYEGTPGSRLSAIAP